MYSHIQLHLKVFQSSLPDFKRYFGFVPGVLPTTDKSMQVFPMFIEENGIFSAIKAVSDFSLVK